MNRRIDPLSPEERDLAERLARLGGPREPAPALDAAILAAARAAVDADGASAAVPPVAPAAAPPGDPLQKTDPPQTDPPQVPASPDVAPFRPRRTVPRWPLGLSVAATVVLAAGIGWKLQGDGEGSSADKAMAPAAAPVAEEDAVLLDPSLDRAPVQPPPLPPPLENAQDALQTRRGAADTVARQVAAKPAAPAADAGFAADAAPAPAPVRESPAPASAPAAAADLEGGALDKVEVTGSRVPRASAGQTDGRDVGAAEYTRTPLDQRRQESRANRLAEQPAVTVPAPAAAPPPPPPAVVQEASPARDRARKANGVAIGGTTGAGAAADAAASAERYDDRPPVSADSPEFRQAWLQRIRALLAAGETSAAAESLQEFRRRYRSVELPEDLRKFAATLPPPAP
ncbi:MAG: hypothetical protein JF600_14330 [Xanthomonadales bacterium]|nr:hypothetical protein [Xanthomonadales bacterium]